MVYVTLPGNIFKNNSEFASDDGTTKQCHIHFPPGRRKVKFQALSTSELRSSPCSILFINPSLHWTLMSTGIALTPPSQSLRCHTCKQQSSGVNTDESVSIRSHAFGIRDHNIPVGCQSNCMLTCFNISNLCMRHCLYEYTQQTVLQVVRVEFYYSAKIIIMSFNKPNSTVT